MSSEGKGGLEDVVVSTSDICFIDGREGRLIYRGYDVDDLAAQSTFEEVVYLLWYGALPTKKEYDAFYKTLSATATRKLPPKLVALLRGLPKKTTPMEVLRTGVSALSAWDPDAADNSREATARKALRLTASSYRILITLALRLNHPEIVDPMRQSLWEVEAAVERLQQQLHRVEDDKDADPRPPNYYYHGPGTPPPAPEPLPAELPPESPEDRENVLAGGQEGGY